MPPLFKFLSVAVLKPEGHFNYQYFTAVADYYFHHLNKTNTSKMANYI